MLSIFPEFLNYGFLGIAIIRIGLGFFMLAIALKIIKSRTVFIEKLKLLKIPFANLLYWPLPVLSLSSSILILIGLYTQIAVLISIYVLLKLSIIDSGENKPIGNSLAVYFLTILIAVALFFLGAGAFAFDLPV